jgi:hypothetical protein
MSDMYSEQRRLWGRLGEAGNEVRKRGEVNPYTAD